MPTVISPCGLACIIASCIKTRKPCAYSYEVDKSTWYPIHFFVHERPYRLLGLFKTDIHFFGLGQAANDPQSRQAVMARMRPYY